MLAEKQLTEWFRSNGVDIGIPFPVPLIGRLCRSALSTDDVLCGFLTQSFVSDNRINYLILRYKSWNDAFSCYTSYGAAFSSLKA